MKLLSYAGANYPTGTAIADAVLAYSLALARQGLTELVRLPFLSDAGETLHLEIPIGWMREIAGISQPDRDPELQDTDTVDQLAAKTEQLDHPSFESSDDGMVPGARASLWSDFDATELEY